MAGRRVANRSYCDDVIRLQKFKKFSAKFGRLFTRFLLAAHGRTGLCPEGPRPLSVNGPAAACAPLNVNLGAQIKGKVFLITRTRPVHIRRATGKLRRLGETGPTLEQKEMGFEWVCHWRNSH